MAGLDDEPHSGRPPKLPEAQRQDAVKIALQEPRSLKTGLKRVADELGKLLSVEPLPTLLRMEGYVWKRMRRRRLMQREEAAFRAAEAELAHLRASVLAGRRAFELWDCEEAGFPLQPVIPSA